MGKDTKKMGICKKKMEVYIKKEKKDGSINNQRRFKKDGSIHKKDGFSLWKKRWMKDKRWIKDGNRPSGYKGKIFLFRICP